MTILNMNYGGGNPYDPFHLNGISDLAVVGGDTEATITWTDPGDLIVDGQTLATWSSTKLVRKTGSAPTDSSDGTLVVTETVADTYSVSGYTDTGLTNGTTYYYGAFAVADNGLETISNTESVTPINWQPGVNTIIYLPLENDLLDHSLNSYTIYNGGTAPTKETIGYRFGTDNGQYLYSDNMQNPTDCITYSMYAYANIDAGVAIMKKHSNAGNPFLYTNIIWDLSIPGYSWQVRTGSGTKTTATDSLSYDTWYHIVCVYDGTNIYAYTNGVLASSLSSVGTLQTGNTPYLIGNYPYLNQLFKGILSDVIIEHSARTAQDVSDYFNQTKSKYGIS